MVNENVAPPKTSGPAEPPRILTEPLPQILNEIENSIKSADTAAKNAREAAEEARKAGEEAATKAERIARQAGEAAKLAAEEAVRKAEEAFRKAEEALLPANLVRRVVSSWEFLTILILVFLGAVFAAISISLGLSLVGR